MPGPILRLAIPSPLYQTFDYLAPTPSTGGLQPGIRIKVPFGRRQAIGFLLEIRDNSPVAPDKLRPIDSVIDAQPVLDAPLLTLLDWAQRYYHHPYGDVLATAVPTLVRQGAPTVAQYPKRWRLSAPGRAALTATQLDHAPRQQALARALEPHPDGLSNEQLRQLLPGYSAPLKALHSKGLIDCHRGLVSVRHARADPPPANAAQQSAIDAVCAAFGKYRTFLLDGVTGSGKTEVYSQIAEHALSQGGQILLLVPEIGLTPQLLTRFEARLDGPFAVFHSGLSDQERLNAWLCARAGVATVVIGTRSAVFTPMPKLAAIIVDEEHDASFKQQDGFRYHARDLAVVRAQQNQLPIVLGSATPALESLHNALNDRYELLTLPDRVGRAKPPEMELINVGHLPIETGLSDRLQHSAKRHLEAGNQVLFFLNRRGFAPTLLCHECAWVGQCRHCDAKLTLHLKRQRLTCHHCGADYSVPTVCPDCGSVDLSALGQGTEQLEQHIEQRFGQYGVARIDRDTTRRKGSMQSLLKEINANRYRVLVGTQMLAKGHHFPNVTLVGIVDADQGLFGVDFRATEKMAQQILQVAGRAGRADKPGMVLIQTRFPNHPFLQDLVSRGYHSFATHALSERQRSLMPPYSYHALLRADAPNPARPTEFLRHAAQSASELDVSAATVEVLGPVPAPMERRAGRYRAQLLVQAEQRRSLHRLLDHWRHSLAGLKSARGVRWSIDVDPIDML